MRHPIDRRRFLALLAATGSIAVAAPAAGRRKVVVLGAGLAGLAAAWNLQQNGYETIVLEAKDIPGGRVKTVREPFTDGGYAEAGAVRIFDNHRSR